MYIMMIVDHELKELISVNFIYCCTLDVYRR